MKVTTTKLFEANQITDEKIRAQVQPLVDYINGGFDQIISALQGKLTFAENMDTAEYTVEFVHNVAKDVTVRDVNRVIGVLPLRLLHASDIIVGCKWSVTTTGALSVKLLFSEANTSERRKVRFLVVYG